MNAWSAVISTSRPVRMIVSRNDVAAKSRPIDRLNRYQDASPNTSSSRCPASMLADRKSTRLNSSHSQISYAVFCLKKKNTNYIDLRTGVPIHLSDVLFRLRPVDLFAVHPKASCHYLPQSGL